VQRSLATKLRVLRAERRLTLRQVEELTGVDKGTISQIERGARHPQGVTLSKLAEGYGVPLEELMPSAGPVQRGTPPLHLAEMDAAQPEDRRRALRSASAEEIEVYLGEIVHVLESAEHGKDDQGQTLDTRAQLVRFAARLGALHAEASAYAARASVEAIA
jgi:transcriptional regulator with XRE-family HTH domain